MHKLLSAYLDDEKTRVGEENKNKGKRGSAKKSEGQRNSLKHPPYHLEKAWHKD